MRQLWVGFALAHFVLLLAGCSGGGENEQAPIVADADGDSVADTNDCAPQDALAWQVLNFSSVDNDGDNARVNAAGQICAGANLPTNRFATAAASADIDCDDFDSTRWATRIYVAVDTDRDGFGVAASGSMCVGAALPAGFLAALPAAADVDCNDADASVWKLTLYSSRDLDGDGYRVNVNGSFCGQGTLPGNFFVATTDISDVDCDDGNAVRWRLLGQYLDADGDGIGAGVVLRQCLGATPSAGYSLKGYDPLDDPNDPTSPTVSELPIATDKLIVPDDTDDDDVN